MECHIQHPLYDYWFTLSKKYGTRLDNLFLNFIFCNFSKNSLYNINLKEFRWDITNGKSRHSGNIGHTRYNSIQKTKKMSNTDPPTNDREHKGSRRIITLPNAVWNTHSVTHKVKSGKGLVKKHLTRKTKKMSNTHPTKKGEWTQVFTEDKQFLIQFKTPTVLLIKWSLVKVLSRNT